MLARRDNERGGLAARGRCEEARWVQDVANEVVIRLLGSLVVKDQD